MPSGSPFVHTHCTAHSCSCPLCAAACPSGSPASHSFGRALGTSDTPAHSAAVARDTGNDIMYMYVSNLMHKIFCYSYAH